MKNADTKPTATHNWLTFTTTGKHYALPADCVREILYPHPVTPLPFVPACITGLINVEGNIAVQVSLSQLVAGQTNTAERVELILIDTGRALCAIEVDGVEGHIALPDQPIHSLPASGTHQLFTGEILHNGHTVHLIDPQSIGRLVQAGAVREDGIGMLGKVDDSNTHQQQGNHACLVVTAGSERYAFELAGITEILETEACTPVPGAPEYLKGFMLLRNQALLVIDFPYLIQQRRTATTANWIVVIEHNGLRYGFELEQILGIEHFPAGSYQAVSDSQNPVAGLFVHDDMTTMLLSSDRLISNEVFSELARYAAHQHSEETVQIEATERYLQVRICNNRFAIPIDNVKRVTRFFPMETAQDNSGTVRGAIDIDGHIIPVLALESALSLDQLSADGEYVIISNQQHEWAICVDLAQRIVDIPLSQISRMSQDESRFINGIAHIDEQLVSLLDFSFLQQQNASISNPNHAAP